MEQCRVFLRNLRWGVNEAQLRAMLQPAGFRVLEVKMVRKSYFGEHSLCSAFVTLDTHEAVDRLVWMLNGCNDYSLTPTAVFAERAVPRMAALRAVQAAPSRAVQAAPKVQAAPTVQAAPKEEEEEEHPGDVYPNLEPELLAEKTEGTAEAAAKEQEDTAAEDTKAAAKEPEEEEEEEEEEKTEIFSSGGEYQDTSPAHSRCSRRRKSSSSRRSRRKSRSSRRKSRSSRRKSRSSQKSRSSRRKSRSSQRSRSSRRKSRSSDGKSSST